jgi:heterotetrameric sarcosine oxidase gamma subunit
MREVADRGMIDLRGEGSSAKFKQAVKSVLGFDLPAKPRTAASKGPITVLWLSVDQWLVTCARGIRRNCSPDLNRMLLGHPFTGC